MPLIYKRTAKVIPSVIERVKEADYALIQSSKEFSFDWKSEKQNEVYKIFPKKHEEEILGLISLIDWPSEHRIHINLIEIGRSNRGYGKEIENIAGCLIAFACRLAFIRGYAGFVSLRPKTVLIGLYRDKYGFREYGRLMAIELNESHALINEYLTDEDK